MKKIAISLAYIIVLSVVILVCSEMSDVNDEPSI